MGIIRFGANGWRARVGSGFDEPSALRIAAALGTIWSGRESATTVLVGFDTRRDSERIALALGEALASFGLTVRVSDSFCPTPALGWSAAHTPGCAGAVMVTASEAPFDYGGILVRQYDGGPMSEGFAERVEQLIAAEPTPARGPVERCDMVGPYLAALLSKTSVEHIRAAGLHVVVDAMYGAGAGYLASLLEGVGCEVSALHGEPVRDFRGLHPDPVEPWVDECERAVVERGADVGIVLDGDGDRAALVDAQGRLVTPYVLAPLALEHVVERVGVGRVVATVASSARIARQAERLDCELTMVPVGFQSMYREFGEGDVILAAEEYGGICVPGHLMERDGLLVGLGAVEKMARARTTLRELVDSCEAEIGRMDYGRRDLRLDFSSIQRLRNMLPGMNPPELAGYVPQRVSHADGLRLQFDDDSWVLLRPARTQSVVRAYAEAPTAEKRSRLLAAACDLAREGI